MIENTKYTAGNENCTFYAVAFIIIFTKRIKHWFIIHYLKLGNTVLKLDFDN